MYALTSISEDLCVSLKRQNVTTGVLVNVEPNVWSLSTIMRELLQNATDAAILSYDTTKPCQWNIQSRADAINRWESTWQLDDCPNMIFASLEYEGTTFTCRIANVGQPLPMDAFQPGSYKPRDHILAAGRYGVGLKNAIGMLFHLFRDRRTCSVSAVTYDAAGWTYDFDHQESKTCWVRTYMLERGSLYRESLYKKFEGCYLMNVHDRMRLPAESSPFMKFQVDRKISATEICFRISGLMDPEGVVMTQFLASLRQHVFTRHPPTLTAGEHWALCPTTIAGRLIIYAYPGLYYSELILDAPTDIMVPASQLPTTNRDRVQEPTEDLRAIVGQFLGRAVNSGRLRAEFEQGITEASHTGTYPEWISLVLPHVTVVNTWKFKTLVSTEADAGIVDALRVMDTVGLWHPPMVCRLPQLPCYSRDDLRRRYLDQVYAVDEDPPAKWTRYAACFKRIPADQWSDQLAVCFPNNYWVDDDGTVWLTPTAVYEPALLRAMLNNQQLIDNVVREVFGEGSDSDDDIIILEWPRKKR